MVYQKCQCWRSWLPRGRGATVLLGQVTERSDSECLDGNDPQTYLPWAAHCVTANEATRPEVDSRDRQGRLRLGRSFLGQCQVPRAPGRRACFGELCTSWARQYIGQAPQGGSRRVLGNEVSMNPCQNRFRAGRGHKCGGPVLL